MSRILAIEADARRRRVLTALVREHVKAELLVVASVQAALAAMADRTPDLIIAPTLLSPPDEAELLTYVKQLRSAPYVQMLTVPALDMLVDAPVAPPSRRSFFPIFNRRPTSLGLQYDRGMVAAQIADGLARAREMRIEYAAMLAYQEAAAQARPTALVPCPRLVPELSDNRASLRPEVAADERRVALRKGRSDVPWLSGIKAAWGSELELINISSTGVLIETGSKFTPGSTTELHLSGPDTNLVVPVRFIRSDVARIDGLGVRYRAAAAFAREVDLAGPGRDAGMPATPPQELAALFSTVVMNSGERRDSAQVRFAQGLRELIGARDVQVRTGSSGSAGAETLYFDVPGEDRARTTLQVTFDRSHHVTSAEFKLLKAAAWLTAAVLELERPVSEQPRMLAERVA
jgi:CheY-like chemotaxis protein